MLKDYYRGDKFFRHPELPQLGEQPRPCGLLDILRFGAGTRKLSEPTSGKIDGSLGGTGWSLSLDGTITDGMRSERRIEGRGIIDSEEWVYDYLGYLVPRWPNGVAQVDTIVGTIIRTVHHSTGQSTAV